MLYVPDSVVPLRPSVWNVQVRTPVLPPAGKLPRASTSSQAWPPDSKLRLVALDVVNPMAVLPKNATLSPDTVDAEPAGAANGISAAGRGLVAGPAPALFHGAALAPESVS